jgi:hypothetical protein
VARKSQTRRGAGRAGVATALLDRALWYHRQRHAGKQALGEILDRTDTVTLSRHNFPEPERYTLKKMRGNLTCLRIFFGDVDAKR